MARHSPTNCDGLVEDKSRAKTRRCFHVDRELVDERIERHRMARRKISLEQIAGILTLRHRAETRSRNIRACDEHFAAAHSTKIRTQWLEIGLTVTNERRLLALPRLHPALERGIYGREGSIRAAQHRLV